MGDKGKGIVSISEELILKWLQFPFGRILDAKYDGFRNAVDILIEDEEMPQNKIPETISLSFITYEDGLGHRVSLRQPLRKRND